MQSKQNDVENADFAVELNDETAKFDALFDFDTDFEDDESDYRLTEYDISSNPNDFNVLTLNTYIERDAIKIPSFQRNYVWDIKRASRWIESLLLGLPVPQLFLYEEARNSLLVIDGQQRLMTIYYYLNGRFPRADKRGIIRRVFDEKGRIPDEVFKDNTLFQDFKLRLDGAAGMQRSPFNGLSYSALEDYQSTLDLRTVRCVVIKQNRPKDGDSSVFEIFNRLNTGGTNLKAQEIRACMYHSEFLSMLAKANQLNNWRRFFGKAEPDLHMRDIEVILRVFAMLEGGGRYTTTMKRFLNDYSRESMSNTAERNTYLYELFRSFIDRCGELDDDVFLGRTNKFNIALFEAVFYAVCKPCEANQKLVSSPISFDKIQELAADGAFLKASTAQTTNSSNVRIRLERAKAMFSDDWV